MNKITNRYHSQPPLQRQQLHSLQTIDKARNRSKSIFLPRIGKTREQKLSQQQIEKVGERVLKLQKMWYGPTGCSKSTMLQKVLMLKKINRRKKLDESKNMILKWNFKSRENQYQITPQIYVNSIEFDK